MKKVYLFVLIFSVVGYKVFSQKYSGTYFGMIDSKRLVASIKVTNGTIIGVFYESRTTKYSLMGTVENNKIDGAIDMMGSFMCQGEWKEDSLFIHVTLMPDITKQIKLKKINNRTEIDFDKHFGKETNDQLLVGDWSLISRFDIKKNEFTKSKDKGMILSANGTYLMKGLPMKPDMIINWYTSDGNLSMRISYKGESLNEFNFGTYRLSGDTLISNNNQCIFKYLRKK